MCRPDGTVAVDETRLTHLTIQMNPVISSSRLSGAGASAGSSDGTVAVDETHLTHLAPDIETVFKRTMFPVNCPSQEAHVRVQARATERLRWT